MSKIHGMWRHMSSAQQEYVRNRLHKVQGWFHRLDAEIFCLLTDYQHEHALEGSVAEIGLHHGKSFIAMCLSLQEGEKAYGIDLFEQQELNADQSGCGDRHTLEENLAATGVDRAAVVLDGRDSGSVRPRDIIESVGAVRFFSIDGGHQVEVVRRDLALAEQTLAAHGIVALDDFLRPEWPDVSAGYFSWFAQRSRALVPFAFGFNKLYLCEQSRVADYMNVLEQSAFLRFFLAKRYHFGGNEIPVFQRFLLPSGQLKQEAEEHVRMFHPDLYVWLKSLRLRSRFRRH